MSAPVTTVASAINQALHVLMQSDERVLIVGEDLLDPYGGAFKITKGLSTNYPDRVLPTPISECGFVGACGGMALRGLRPVAEIMFGDFSALIFDQLLNHLSKFALMFDGKVSCPITLRLPMGGRRGYGATHSQCLEKYFVGIPGLRVMTVSAYHDISAFYREAVLGAERPTILIEDKTGYSQPYRPLNANGIAEFEAREIAPHTLAFSANGFGSADATLVTYGGMTGLVLEAAKQLLFERELFVEVIVLGQLAPFRVEDLADSLKRSGRLLFAEEGTRRAGVGAEITAAAMERYWKLLRAPMARVAARDFVIPATKVLEDAVLPSVADVKTATLNLINHP
ncbi:MAG: alpha-ketoacid dehydrogenase subunit beta [Verrucomicrobiaceae bacterium]